MKSFIGHIVAADCSQKEFTVKCSDGVRGIVIGEEVNIIPVESDFDRYVKSEGQDKTLKVEPHW